MAFTIYGGNKFLNKQFGGTDYTPPATFYFGLSTTAIGYSGSSASEPTDSAYARIAVTNNKSYFSTATTGSLTNSGSIVFAQSSGSWGTITDVGIWDALSGGNCWHYQALGSSRIVSGSSIVQFLPQSLTISAT